MQTKIDYLVATTGRSDLAFIQAMNIHGKAIITNQSAQYHVTESGDYTMITTPTKGVGINRNLGLALTKATYSLIVDDDMIFYDNATDIIENALKTYPNADIIIFNFDYVKNGNIVRSRMKKTKAINFFNCLNYGICCTLINNNVINKYNISFSTLFGGGCIYSCGEDSLFFLDCVRKGLKVYTYLNPIGQNVYRESTWFNGYNEKFFYDKGAWIACAFPKLKHFIKWYFIVRFRKLSGIPLKKIRKYVNAGIKGFSILQKYSE